MEHAYTLSASYADPGSSFATTAKSVCWGKPLVFGLMHTGWSDTYRAATSHHCVVIVTAYRHRSYPTSLLGYNVRLEEPMLLTTAPAIAVIVMLSVDPDYSSRDEIDEICRFLALAVCLTIRTLPTPKAANKGMS